MTMTSDIAPIQIPLIPNAGEVWFFLDLNLVTNIPETFVLVRALGFTPVLAYRYDMGHLEICLLLYFGVVPGMSEPPRELFQREQEILANNINTDAIHFVCGLTRQGKAIAA